MMHCAKDEHVHARNAHGYEVLAPHDLFEYSNPLHTDWYRLHKIPLSRQELHVLPVLPLPPTLEKLNDGAQRKLSQ